MRKSILAISALSFISITQAAYTIIIPMEQSRGGALPNGSINITPRTPGLPAENWQPAEPIYTDWTNIGNISGCSNWTPAPSTVLKDEEFNQSATDCNQYQTRTRQAREQETTTLAYRNVGPAVTMGQDITVNSNRTATGTAACSYIQSKTYWFTGTSYSSNAYIVKVNGVELKSVEGYYTTSFTLNGITYKRGTTVKNSITNEYGTYRYYEVCK